MGNQDNPGCAGYADYADYADYLVGDKSELQLKRLTSSSG
jgi:hypothetical protein